MKDIGHRNTGAPLMMHEDFAKEIINERVRRIRREAKDARRAAKSRKR